MRQISAAGWRTSAAGTEVLFGGRDVSALPAWERPNMVAKYYVTTTGTELSRKSPARPATRIAPR